MNNIDFSAKNLAKKVWQANATIQIPVTPSKCEWCDKPSDKKTLTILDDNFECEICEDCLEHCVKCASCGMYCHEDNIFLNGCYDEYDYVCIACQGGL